MTTVLFVARKVILVATALMHSAMTVMILVISPKTVPRKLPHQGQPIIIIDLAPTHIITTAAGRGHSPSITYEVKGTALTGQDHAIDPSMTEALVTTGGMHPTLYPITTAILGTPLQTGILDRHSHRDTHTGTGTTHLDSHQPEATSETSPLITFSLA